MYTTTVKTRKRLEGKSALKIAAPVFLWWIAQAVVFLVAVKTEPLVMPFFFIVLLTVIPITYCMREKAAEFRGKESFQYEDVTFHVLGGELYVDDIKLTVTYNESKTRILVDHIVTYKQKYGLMTKVADFIGWVEEPYLGDFIRFLEEEGVKINVEIEVGEN